MKRFLPLLLILFTACSTPAERAAAGLARRIAPSYAGRIRFQQTSDTCDVFEVATAGRRLLVRGNNAGAMAAGLNWYLKNVCLTTVSWDAAHPVEVPAAMPLPDTPVRIAAKVPRRFFLNQCTFGYTMPWWKWEEWERFIDWMALNGVNEPLAMTGQEAVWQRVWRRHGLSDAQVRSFFTGPAHLPWNRVCNIDGVDGPLPQGWIDAQVDLQKRILARERSLGMRPVLPAFAGHVPAALTECEPRARAVQVSPWGGFPQENRSWFLPPTDSLYAVIQEEFLREQASMFGTSHLYAFDLFNEVDAPSWEPDSLAAFAREAYGSLAAVDSLAVWIQAGWLFHYDRKHWTPERVEAYLEAVPKGRATLLDYYTEHTPVWTMTDSFHGQPYLFCYLGNFGGNTFLAGAFRTQSARISDAMERGGSNLQGLGATLEGFGVNMPMYEYLLDRAWDTGLGDDQWTMNLADRRFGTSDPAVREAWRSLLDSVYVHGAISQGSLLCGRPCLEGWKGWTVISKTWWDGRTLDRVWTTLLDHPSPRDTYRYDVVNLGCQVLGNRFGGLRDRFAAAYRAGDLDAARGAAAQMEALAMDIARLSACEPTFRLDCWLQGAADFALSAEEEAYYLRNAWHLVTTWGGGGSLKDYGSRLWSGLVVEYYLPRWRMFTSEVLSCMEEGRPFDQAALDSRLDSFEEGLLEAPPREADLPAGDWAALARETRLRWVDSPAH